MDRYFNRREIFLVDEAIEVAEEVVGDFFSIKDWKDYPYDVKTLIHIPKKYIKKDKNFAFILKGVAIFHEQQKEGEEKITYFICLNDPVIIDAVKRDKDISLWALLTYIITHELTHVVRFFKYPEKFNTTKKERDKEEFFVHSATYEMLKKIGKPDLIKILNSYHFMRDYSAINRFNNIDREEFSDFFPSFTFSKKNGKKRLDNNL